MKILIVDDEIFVRVGIKTTLDWAGFGHVIIGEAADGVEGIEMFTRYEPDIVLTDILMPNLDGLDFIRQVKRLNPSCKFIVMSCHNEFEYVREAMKLGVRDYIMKTTVKRDELLEIINKVSEEIRQERSRADELEAEKRESLTNRHIIVGEYLNRVIDGLETDEGLIASKLGELQLGLHVPGLYLILLSVGSSRKTGRGPDPRDNDLLIHGVTNMALELYRQQAEAVLVKRSENEVAAFVCLDQNESDEGAQQRLSDISVDVIKAARDFLSASISVGISPEITKLTDIRDAYRKAVSALERKFFVGPSNVIVYRQAREADDSYDQQLVAIEQEVIDAVKQMNFEKADNILSGIRSSEIIRSGTDPLLVRNTFLNLALNLMKHVEYEFLSKEEMEGIAFNPNEVMKFDYFEDMLDYLIRSMRAISDTVDNKFNVKYKNALVKIKEIIHQNLGDDFTLKAAAEYVNLSPGYFSRLFKRLTGENFIDYVMKVKMEKAKSMIRDGEKLWVISQKLGYTEVSSFSRTFKRMEGVSPMQYRMRITAPEQKKVKES